MLFIVVIIKFKKKKNLYISNIYTVSECIDDNFSKIKNML